MAALIGAPGDTGGHPVGGALLDVIWTAFVMHRVCIRDWPEGTNLATTLRFVPSLALAVKG
jgi:hypothetical protein